MARHMIPRAGPDELAEFGLLAHLGLGSDLFMLEEFLPLLDFIAVVNLRIVYPRLVSKAYVFDWVVAKVEKMAPHTPKILIL